MKNILNNDVLDNFLDSIWAEQGLSKNTLISYEHDIKTFLIYLNEKNIDLNNAQHTDNSFPLQFCLRWRKHLVLNHYIFPKLLPALL